MSKTYIAKLNDKVVGKRTTKDRTYTHAIVVVPSVEYHRQQAYGYVAGKTDQANYSWYCAVAEGRTNKSQDEVIKASVKIDGGFAAFVERTRQGYIERFEADLAAGKFEPHVSAWAGRPDLALKAAAQYRHPMNKVVEIVQAELVVPKKSRQGYNPVAVNEAIEASNRAGQKINGKEARAIHALLKGR